MGPDFVLLAEKKLVGLAFTMSLVHDQTLPLWQAFRAQQQEIPAPVGSDLYSLREYPPHYFTHFDPTRPFKKWAAIEVFSFEVVPPSLAKLVLPASRYAVFHYRGRSTDSRIYAYIYGEWLPQSGYALDDRPHFEVLGENYRNDDPHSEESIWIPVR